MISWWVSGGSATISLERHNELRLAAGGICGRDREKLVGLPSINDRLRLASGPPENLSDFATLGKVQTRHK
jgi:hypothetical protein